ncbi:MAG: hypothetical protein ACP5D9_18750, partial [Mariniphaga sp.]
MDRNSILGIVLIFAILVVFSIINQPSKEEIEAARHRRDSIALVEAEKARQSEEKQQQALQDVPSEITAPDSLAEGDQLQEKIDQFGIFGTVAVG